MKGQIHLHTKASDGIITAHDIVKSGLDFVAITDHDTVRGYDKLMNIDYLGFNLNVIPGIELTAKHLGKGVHILVYYPSYDQEFLSHLEKTGNKRKQRAFQIAEKVEELGFYCPRKDLMQYTGIITKGCIAEVVFKHKSNKALLEKQDISTEKEFIKTYLERGKIAYFDAPRTEFKVLDKLVSGIRVLAHPGHDLEPGKDDYIIEDLVKKYKLVGIEANSRKHENGQTEYYNNLAKELGLVVTTSADAHKPEQLTENAVDYTVITDLIEKFKEITQKNIY